MAASEWQLLGGWAREAGLGITTQDLVRFGKYAEMLTIWNQRVNLTAIEDGVQVVRKHFLDSLWGLSRLPLADGDTVVDVGSGGGFPGVIVGLMRPLVKVSLLEATGKKAEFLRAVVEELRMENTTVLHGRAEEVGHGFVRESFDGAVSRAVAAMPVLAELCLPLVRVGGWMAAWKGPNGGLEAREATRATTTVGGELVEVVRGTLPGGGEVRTMVIIRKACPTPPIYPRRAGMPAKRPL